jgi:hypothetical protein
LVTKTFFSKEKEKQNKEGRPNGRKNEETACPITILPITTSKKTITTNANQNIKYHISEKKTILPITTSKKQEQPIANNPKYQLPYF